MKTAIEQIKEKLKNIGFMNVDEFFVEFLETEKQQIIEAYNSSSWETDKDIEGHHYYDEKFKNKQPLM